MPLGRFVAYTFTGNALYSVALVGLGWWLDSQWKLVEQYVPIVKYVVVAALAGVVIRFVWRRRKAHR